MPLAFAKYTFILRKRKRSLNDKRIVKVGIIGCGGIANKKYMPTLKKQADVEMVAFCDILSAKAEKAAKATALRRRGVPTWGVFLDEQERGGDTVGNVRIHTVRDGRQSVTEVQTSVCDATLYGGTDAYTREARLFLDAIKYGTAPSTLPEEAYCVTRIPEGIYTSAKTGDIYRFDACVG